MSTAVLKQTLESYNRMIRSVVDQLSDLQLQQRPQPGFNSVSVLLRHLGGNLQSRWTDFLTTDGEKPDRNRDEEFEDWSASRNELLDYFDKGIQAFADAIQVAESKNLNQTITIRGESHTLEQAFMRSITHLAYHAGQIAFIGRMVHGGEWNWLTIRPGHSSEFNQATWGKPKSRAILNDLPETQDPKTQ